MRFVVEIELDEGEALTADRYSVFENFDSAAELYNNACIAREECTPQGPNGEYTISEVKIYRCEGVTDDETAIRAVQQGKCLLINNADIADLAIPTDPLPN